MILKELLKQPATSTLIEDSWLLKGRPLFLSLIRHYSENGFTIRYLKYDSPLSNEKDDMEQFSYSREIQIISGTKTLSSLASGWSSESKGEKDHVVVAIDSLSPLLLNWSVGEIASALRNLLETKKVSVIAMVHSDVHDKPTLKALDYIFTCHLTLKKVLGSNVCSGTWRKTSGKIIDSDECYTINEKCELTDVKEFTAPTTNVILESLSKSAVPKSTFKLDLNAREEEARSQVVLPYIRKANETSSKPSQVIYEAEAHDWDDEDPDDDLEI